MRLFITPASPFARKCRIVIREKKLDGMVEEVVADFTAEDPRLVEANPVSQVPALVTDDGLTLIDSPLICAWLDAYSGRPRLCPEGDAQWNVRRMEALADAALEMAVKLVLEGRRPESERSQTWIARWRRGLHRTLDAAERAAPEAEPLNIGVIALGVVGPYVELRFPDIDWRANRPRLAALTDTLSKRPSFQATAPA
ncbi:MAG TPA: glutathione S-transferase N-terminal domain-containing protein [Caulobacteraceae bacterium]|jgi:glutathione S-transferase